MHHHHTRHTLTGEIFHTRSFVTSGPDGPATLTVVIIQTPTGLRCGYGNGDLSDALHLLQLHPGDQVRLILDDDCLVTTVEAAR